MQKRTRYMQRADPEYKYKDQVQDLAELTRQRQMFEDYEIQVRSIRIECWVSSKQTIMRV